MAFIPLSGEIDPKLLMRLHALNEAHAVELSSLTPQRLQALIAAAWLAMADDDGGALLIAFDQDSAYDGLNFQWFKARLGRFVYVDRVVVADSRRGEGLARRMYEKVISASGDRPVVCEVNYDPPNPASEAFHARLGFAEVGRILRDGKGVRYLMRTQR